METKKQLGQHWLHDEIALEAMCEAIQITANDTVLEIGPGLGTLTDRILATGARVHAVEFDQELIPGLHKKFAGQNIIIEQGDILKFDFGKLPVGYKVAANIPYYLTSNLLRVLSETPHHFTQAALLVQKEVALRVCAKPGSMSLLSVSVQLYCDVSLGRVVSAELFTPRPKVDSQILVLSHLGQPRFDVDTKKFFHLVKAGFSERRKMLRSSLSGGLGISKQEAEVLLSKSAINPELRAQALSMDDWYKLFLVSNP